MKNLKTFYYPETLDEAVKILKDDSLKAGIIAGGTSVALSSDMTTEALVDITRLGLDYIDEESGSLIVGATATAQDLVKSPLARKYADGVLAEAAAVMASRPLRNVITVGGNIVMLRIWSDLPALLLALEAQIEISGANPRTLTAEEFFESHPVKILEPGDIVTKVIFPPKPANSTSIFIKQSKTVGDYAIVSVAAYLERDGDKVKKARIAVGSASTMPCRCLEAEKYIEGMVIDTSALEDAGKIARGEVKTVSGTWASAEYRSILVERLVMRALEQCLKKPN